MSDVVKQLASEHGLLFCVQCGKCSAVCPMWKLFAEYSRQISPRGVIEKVLLDDAVPEDGRLWFCLTCDMCTDFCPAGVRFRDFVEAARRLLLDAGVIEYACFCQSCGVYLWPQHTTEYVKQMLGDDSQELLTLCPRCRQYDFADKIKALAPASR